MGVMGGERSYGREREVMGVMGGREVIEGEGSYGREVMGGRGRLWELWEGEGSYGSERSHGGREKFWELWEGERSYGTDRKVMGFLQSEVMGVIGEQQKLWGLERGVMKRFIEEGGRRDEEKEKVL